MTEQFSLLELPLIGGIDQHTDSRKVSGASVLRAENVQIQKVGRFDKRWGTTGVTTTMLNGATAMASSNVNLAARGSSLLVAESARLLAQSSAKNRFVAVDSLPNWYATDIQLSQAGGFISDPDTATMASGYTCAVYVEGTALGTAGNVMAVILDAYTGSLVLQTQLSSGANGLHPRVVARGTVFVCVWDNGTTTLIGRRIDMSVSTLAWDAAVNLRTDRTGTGGWNICPSTVNSTDWYLAYQTGAAGNRVISLYSYGNDASLTQVASATTGDTHNAAYRSVAIVCNSLTTRLAVVYTYDDGGGNDVVRGAIHNATTLANTVAGFTIKSDTALGDGGQVRVTVCARTTTGYQVAWMAYVSTGAGVEKDSYVEAGVITDAGATSGTNKILYSASLDSHLTAMGSSTYAVCSISNNGPFMPIPPAGGEVLDRNAILVDFTGYDTASTASVPVPVCTMATRIGAADIHSVIHQTHMTVDPNDSTSYITSYGQLSALIQSATTTALAPMTFSLSRVTQEAGKRQSCELGGLTYFSGGIPTWYDGVRVAEVGFLCQPHVVLVSSNGAGSLDVAVDYQYAIVQVQKDAAGNVHRGIPFKRTITMGGADDTNTLYVSYYGCTLRQDAANGTAPVTFEIYRTEGGGTQLRLIAEMQTNLTSSACLTYTDLAADTALPYAPFLYDTATPDGRSQLAHVNPPSATLCMTHRDRVWFAGCPNRKEIWISSKYVPGEAPFFSEAFRLIVDDGGDITAIASMDDKAIIFKDDRIFMVTGDGPDDSGNNSDWSPATRILSTVGCIEPRSVAVTPIGILFQSRVGLSLLTRDLQVIAHWGRPVEDSLAGRTIVRAYAHKTSTEIRVLLDNGWELRFDYHAQAWTKSTGLYELDARYVGTTLYYLGASGIRYENRNTYMDDSAGTPTWVTMLIELAPISAAGRLGYQNVTDVMALVDHWTDHEMLIEVASDTSGYVESNQWSAATLLALGNSEYVLQYKPKRAGRSRLAKVRISDATPTSGSVGTGQSFALVAATLRVGNKGDKYQLLGSTQKG